MLDDILKTLADDSENTLKALKLNLTKVRTGRANPMMLEGIRVDYYGTPTPINQVSAIKVTDARMIMIQPWEKTMLAPIEKAILAANIGLTPNNDGSVVRLPVPPLTGERRQELTRNVKAEGEKAKVALRNHRRDCNEMVKELEKDGDISEDDLRTALTKIQTLIDQYVTKVDQVITAKEQEILEV
jgi:ribosome recycling factor